MYAIIFLALLCYAIVIRDGSFAIAAGLIALAAEFAVYRKENKNERH